MNTRFGELMGKYRIGTEYKNLAIFLSGAMTGLTPEEQKGWRDKIKNWMICEKVVIFDPTCFDAESKDAEVQENGFNFDISSIINSDMVILNLKKCMTSVGTCQEIMLAWLLGIPIIGFWEKEEDVVPLHPWIEKELTCKFKNIEILRYFLYNWFSKWEKNNE